MTASSDALQTAIVVPAYNEAAAVGGVVRDLLSDFPLVITVDDGSRDGTATQARKAGAVVLRHVLNRGQGAALQTGIEYALRQGADVIVTFDADGQHRVEDVHRLVDALTKSNADVAIGSRFLELRSNVPARRRFVLKIAAVFMRFTSGIALTDAHNGLRAFTAEAASKIHLTIDGMAHASEIIDQIYDHRLKYVEVPIVVHYTEYSMRKGQSSLAAIRIAFDYLMKRLFR